MSAGIFEGSGQDLKYAWRGLLQHPGLSVLAMLTLALGLGATTAIFSVVHGVLLQPLPYPHPDRLMAVWEVTRSGNHSRLADPNFDDLRDQSHSFAALAKYQSAIAPVTGLAEPVRANIAVVSRDFFAVLGTGPAIGRRLTAEDTRPGAAPAVLASHAFWQTHLGPAGMAAENLAAVRLRIDGRDYAVAGILPPGFDFPAKTDLWLPAELDPENPSRTSHNFSAIGRLRDGISAAAASADLNAIAQRIVRESSEQGDYLLRGAGAGPLQAALTGRVRSPLYLPRRGRILPWRARTSPFSPGRGRRSGDASWRFAAPRAGQTRLVRQFIAEAFLLSGLSAPGGDRRVGGARARAGAARAPAAGRSRHSLACAGARRRPGAGDRRGARHRDGERPRAAIARAAWPAR
jgi:hypothetical protein